MNQILGVRFIAVFFCGLLLLAGGWSLYNNKIQLLPDVEPPKISFVMQWPGASEDFLIAEVVKPYEDAILGRLEHFRQLKVTSKPQRVSFEVEFKQGTDLMEAERALSALLARARPLPQNVKPLEYRHGGLNVSNRVVGSYFITANSTQFSLEQIKLIKDIAEQQLKLLPGMDKVELNPLPESQLTVKLDLNKLYLHGLSFIEVRRILSGILSQPVATLFENDRVITAKFQPDQQLNEIAATPVAFVNGTTVRLEDVAAVAVKPVRANASVRYNGDPAIAMRLLRTPEANLLEVQRWVDEVLAGNQSQITASGLNYHLSFDTAVFIERAIYWVVGSIFIGFVLSLLVSWLFFRRIKPTLLAALITVLSMCGILVMLNLMGTSINVISLAGITFAVGMFVDGVLIFVEYLDRLPKQQKETVALQRKALRKLVPALAASTFTTVVVFLPVIFSQDAQGQLFGGLSLVIVTGLILALALTLLITPWFGAKYLSSEAVRPACDYRRQVNFITSMLEKKSYSLTCFLVLLIGCTVGAVIMLPSMSYLPSVKRDAIDVYIPLSGADTVEKVERVYVEPLSKVLAEVGETTSLKNHYALGWRGLVTGAVRLEDSSQIPVVIKQLKARLKELFPKTRVIVVQGDLFGGLQNGNNIDIVLSVADKLWLADNASKIIGLVKDNITGVAPRFIPNIETKLPEMSFVPSIAGMQQAGVTIFELKQLVSALGQSDFIGKWHHQGEVVDGLVAIEQASADLFDLPLVTDSGVHATLGSFLEVEKSTQAPSLHRINGSGAVTLSLRFTAPALTVSDVMSQLEQKVLPQLRKMIGAKGLVEVKGSGAGLNQTKRFLSATMGFVLLGFLLIVSFLFKSLRMALYVLCSLPAALFGAVLGFVLLSRFTAADFNVLTMLGFMIMLGVVANNAILLVDAIERGYRQHTVLMTAIAEGMASRFRAILVSTLTTVLGMLPLLLLPSTAAQIYQGIAAVIVGGILFNLISVFWLIPAMVRLFGLPDVRNQPQLQSMKSRYSEAA
ncbi:efflux RND transporter permease subunit [Alteromonas stellipolaris]|uniref:efflux RND transporter permease subunit n=1 Tax=Alteromonas stellipolaris TaxID=233316 RepID=UPI001D8F6225|nr:efflux RND transporter permease subunit [Alteromonas stellipolaris]MBZ2163250.1 efflux RND transporter permease subunit [Alteromonas stellipolaris]